MTPFEEVGINPEHVDPHYIAEKFCMTVDAARAYVKENEDERVFVNDKYTVFIRERNWRGTGKMLWLSIKRNDKEAIHDWRDLQRIKNMLVGDECEGMELYPAESRHVDHANQYHLWVFTDPKIRFPFGFNERGITGPEAAAAVGAKQRPFDNDKGQSC